MQKPVTTPRTTRNLVELKLLNKVFSLFYSTYAYVKSLEISAPSERSTKTPLVNIYLKQPSSYWLHDKNGQFFCSRLHHYILILNLFPAIIVLVCKVINPLVISKIHRPVYPNLLHRHCHHPPPNHTALPDHYSPTYSPHSPGPSKPSSQAS